MEIILKYFNRLSDIQIQQLQTIGDLYRDWNQKINVVSRKDINHLYTRHVLHSLAIARYVQFSSGTRILDVGTGGGFPGIPLAIFFPESEFTLVDSISKKIKVVSVICEEVGLKNIRVLQSRAETLKGTFDFVVSRAVASLPVLLKWTMNKISKNPVNKVPNGIIALKGGDLSRELNIPNHVNIINLSTYFEEPFFETKLLLHVVVGKSI